MNRQPRFKQADATKALKSVLNAGLKPISCTIAPDGSIRVEFPDAARTRKVGNSFDDMLGD